VADGDVVVAEQDLVDDEAHDLLALLDREVLCVVGEARAERVERLGQFEIGLGVVQFVVEGVQLGAQGRLTPTQFGHTGAKFLQRDQLLLVAVDQSAQRILRTGQVALEPVAAAGSGVLAAERLEPPVDLGLDQLGVLQQREHLGPDRLIDLVNANGASGADPALGASEAVSARAAVVVMHVPGLAARRAAVVGVAALAADEHPLQQRWLACVARREPAVALKQLLSERVLLLADQRRHRYP
jgi:hypothetical protein